jgi:hypothetical protein
MGFVGAQPARRNRDWLTVKIGIPETWWREPEAGYKKHLTDEMDRGFESMVALLEQYQDRYTQGLQSSFMLEFSGEVTAT